MIHLQVQWPLLSTGLELYQLGVHTRAKNKKNKIKAKAVMQGVHAASTLFKPCLKPVIIQIFWLGH